jgi:uncharacterized OsmC-like protein
MDSKSIADAVQRVETAFVRKPGLALHDDVPACAEYVDGLRTRIATPTGRSIQTDLDALLGGDGDGPSPGWLMRAGLAACLCSSVALNAARRGIALTRLEVRALSTSDARGLLQVEPAVPAGPLQLRLEVTIAADGADAAMLHELVAWSDAHSPVSDALRRAIDLQLHVDTAGA